jgi:hypothetical protein
MGWGACVSGLLSPFSFIELFKNGTALAKMALVGGMQCFTDGKNINDLEQLWFVDAVRMPVALNTAYVIFWGTGAMVSGAAVVPWLLKRLVSGCSVSYV